MAKSAMQKFMKGKGKKINPYSSVLSENEYSVVNEWISTGSYAINALLSGDLYGGIPNNRSVGIAGLSGTFKSFLLATTARELQKKGYSVALWDSENAWDADFATRLGVDADNLGCNPVDTVEALHQQVVQFYTEWFKDYEIGNYKDAPKLAIIVDSLGNLSTEKSKKNALEGHSAQDMGLKAKSIRDMFRNLTFDLGVRGVPLICVNHTYADPNNPYGGQKTSGGEGLVYNTSQLLIMTKLKLDDKTLGAGMVGFGSFMKVSTKKNRFVPEGSFCKVAVTYADGMNQYVGLLDWAIEFGIIKPEGRMFLNTINNKKEYQKNCYNGDYWDKDTLDALNEKLRHKFSFSVYSEEELKEIEKSTSKEKK